MSAKRELGDAVARTPALQALANFPLAFEANEGQTDAHIKFLARESGAELSLASNETTLRFSKAALSFRFAGANTSPKIVGADPLLERRNYFLGNNPAKWHMDVPTFRKVVYEQLYPGIDLSFYGSQKQIEYDFEVAPGADPTSIRLAFDRGVQPRIAEGGDLIIKGKGIELIERKPIIYQTLNGERHTIEGNYKLLSSRAVRFEIAEYDRTKPLVIDPTLVYSTYLGGSGDDSGSSIAIDSNGNVYVTGATASTNFPTHGPTFASNKGLSDIFVTKIDPAGANIVYSTYIGGSGLDRADGIAIDSSGNAYVVGRVGDTSMDFPTTAGSLAPTYRGGDFDGFVLKLNAAGNALVYSSFIGGEDNDSTEGIAVDSSGNAYLT
ncbi:MAG TPA: SBBP repeat-containing protein, partial [Pyrinomonadaceae bacterium]|nr:SBBP repeat-containing protein [Pyrinomonadaceae bacterium]